MALSERLAKMLNALLKLDAGEAGNPERLDRLMRKRERPIKKINLAEQAASEEGDGFEYQELDEKEIARRRWQILIDEYGEQFGETAIANPKFRRALVEKGFMTASDLELLGIPVPSGRVRSGKW